MTPQIFADELRQMLDDAVLAAIVAEREARRIDRLEMAFGESMRRGLWMQPYYRARPKYRHRVQF